jgi:REP element-mobilizing transposase RayT
MNDGSFYRRRLPHWEMEDAVYFITFRVNGSLPRDLLRRAEAEIQRSKASGELERLTVRERYLDQDTTNPILAKIELAELVRDALLFHHGKKYELLAWCIMPNHVHLLLKPGMGDRDAAVPAVNPDVTAGTAAVQDGVPSLASIIHSIKSYTAHQAVKLGLVQGALWQREYFDRRVRNDDELQRYSDYICQNPVLAGLVKDAKDYPWIGTPPSRR